MDNNAYYRSPEWSHHQSQSPCRDVASEEWHLTSSARPRTPTHSFPYCSSRWSQRNSLSYSSQSDDHPITEQLFSPPPPDELMLYSPPRSNYSPSNTSFSSCSSQENSSYSLQPQAEPLSDSVHSYPPRQISSQRVPFLGNITHSANRVAIWEGDGSTAGEPSLSPSTSPILRLHPTNQPNALDRDCGILRKDLSERNGVNTVLKSGGTYDEELQNEQCVSWSSTPPFHPFTRGNYNNPFGPNKQAESTTYFQEDSESHLLVHDVATSPTLANYGEPVHQVFETTRVNTTFPSMCHCYNSDEVYRHSSAWLVHYWTNHPPSAGWKPKTCLWEGCRCKTEFKTHKNWLEHARNVHQKRYLCKVSGCPRDKPFGSQAMLDRHHSSRHTARKPCTKPNCQGRKNASLSRKDKRSEHEAKWHGPLECQVTGCARRRIDGVDHGFSNVSELNKHMKRMHKYSPSWYCATWTYANTKLSARPKVAPTSTKIGPERHTMAYTILALDITIIFLVRPSCSRSFTPSPLNTVRLSLRPYFSGISCVMIIHSLLSLSHPLSMSLVLIAVDWGDNWNCDLIT